MSEQLTDPFIWEKEKMVLIEAENIYDLFDPEKYGLEPTAIASNCWKGFIVQFSIRKKKLYLDKLLVHNKTSKYPKINGVRAIWWWSGYHLYWHLNMRLHYSGTIVVGKDFDEFFHDRAFTGPHCYNTTYELQISDGILIDSKNTSGSYSGF